MLKKVKKIILNILNLRNYLIKCKQNKRYKTAVIGDNNYIDKTTKIGKCVRINDNCVIKDSLIGDLTYICSYSYINNCSIGKFCSIAQGVKFGLGMHPTSKYVSSHPAFYSVEGQTPVYFADRNYFYEHREIVIGNDVWIGANVVILDGVEIGDGAIIAAGAIVNKSVPPYAIFGGVPAKLISYRFSDDDIVFLLKVKWWDMNYDEIKKNWTVWHDINLFKDVYKF